MSSKKQTQYGEGTNSMKKSAGKGKKSNQPLSNDECCNTNAELDASKEELISRKNKSSCSLWFMVRLFVVHANREDLKWLHNLIKGFENNYDSDVFDIPVDLNKDNEDEYLAKNMLNMKLNMRHSETETVLSPTVQPYAMRFVFQDTDGQQLIISRETVKLNLTKNYVKPVTELLSLTPSNKISYEFIAKLIKWDDTFSHLRGISPKEMDDYVDKCQEEDCLEKVKIEIKKLDKKILSYKKRGKYSLQNQRKTALVYKKYEDIRLILEKYDYFVSDRHIPYFMFH